MIEMLVAVVILAVGLLGLAELQVTAMRTNAKSEGILAATSLAQEILENVTELNDSDPMFNASVTDRVWPGNTPGQPLGTYVLAGGGSYNVTYDVVTNYQGVTNLCLVRVEVTPSVMPLLGVFTNRGATMTTLKRAT